MGVEKHICKECKMKFDDEKRLERHLVKAKPKKRRFSNPDEYWHDPGAGI